MNISEKTISELVLIIIGNHLFAPCRSYSEVKELFKEFEEIDSDQRYLPTNIWEYTRYKIEEINGTSNLRKLIDKILDPKYYHFNEQPIKEFSLKKVAEHLNKFLEPNYKIVKIKQYYKVKDNRDITVQCEIPFNNAYIEELSQKCEEKIMSGDFDGAITNARTLLEAALRHIENELNEAPPKQDGDLPALLGRIKKLLNLDPSRKNIANSLRQIIQGLTSVVDGLSAISNIMADRHAREYAPMKYHAQLAVNTSKTVASFILQSFSYQLAMGSISPKVTEITSKNEEENLEQPNEIT